LNAIRSIEATEIHIAARRRGSVAARGKRAAGGADAAHRRADERGRGRLERTGKHHGVRAGRAELGWTVGRNVRIDLDRVRRYAAELIALSPDVVLATAGSIVGAFRQASRTVPIVFVTTIDPVGGGWVRMRRLMLAMSQEKLGGALGLTFQQVQKYERGVNRIGASRLQQISDILQVPVAFFFEDAPNALAPHGGSALSMAQIDDFVSDIDGLRLIGAFMRIDNPALRRRIVMLVQEIAGDDDQDA